MRFNVREWETLWVSSNDELSEETVGELSVLETSVRGAPDGSVSPVVSAKEQKQQGNGKRNASENHRCWRRQMDPAAGRSSAAAGYSEA